MIPLVDILDSVDVLDILDVHVCPPMSTSPRRNVLLGMLLERKVDMWTGCRIFSEITRPTRATPTQQSAGPPLLKLSKRSGAIF